MASGAGDLASDAARAGFALSRRIRRSACDQVMAFRRAPHAARRLGSASRPCHLLVGNRVEAGMFGVISYLLFLGVVGGLLWVTRSSARDRASANAAAAMLAAPRH